MERFNLEHDIHPDVLADFNRGLEIMAGLIKNLGEERKNEVVIQIINKAHELIEEDLIDIEKDPLLSKVLLRLKGGATDLPNLSDPADLLVLGSPSKVNEMKDTRRGIFVFKRVRF